jgi:hypothetical protein
MDSDEFDGDDLADEDFIVAATQATTPPRASSNPSLSSHNRVQPGVQSSAASISFDGSMPYQSRLLVS